MKTESFSDNPLAIDLVGEKEKLQQELKHLYQAIFKAVEEHIKANSVYSLNDKAEENINALREKLVEVDPAKATLERATLLALEYIEEKLGALPGELGEKYIQSAYSISEIQARMALGQEKFEAIKHISQEIKRKDIFLNEEAVRRQIRESVGKIEELETVQPEF